MSGPGLGPAAGMPGNAPVHCHRGPAPRRTRSARCSSVVRILPVAGTPPHAQGRARRLPATPAAPREGGYASVPPYLPQYHARPVAWATPGREPRPATSGRQWRPPRSKGRPAVAAPSHDRFHPGPRPACARRASIATSAPTRDRWLPGGSASGTRATGRRVSLRPARHGAAPPDHGPNWSASRAAFARDPASVRRANARRPSVRLPSERRPPPPGRAFAPGRSGPTRGPIPRETGRHRGAARRRRGRAAAWRPREVDRPIGAHR